MDQDNIERNLTCVLFPAIVKNEEKAIQCLGGIKHISQVCTSNKQRLDMSFQPNNPYIKKIYADGRKSAGLLLKIKVKKTKNGDEIKRQVVSTSVLGRVKNIYKFESLCDFQYLPVTTDEDLKPRCILDDIIPSGLDTFDFMKRPGPSFIVPPNFTRCEKPMNYYYTDIHHIKREDRSMPCPRFVFNLVDDFPTEPDPYYINKKQLRFEMYPQAEEEFKKLEKLFEEKPVWSMSEVRYHTKGKIMSLKMLLPCLAVYLSEGPWRAMWVKFGYDPRKDSSARMYQTLDFRVRSTGGMNIMVMNKHKQRRNGKYTKTLRRNVEELSDDDVITEASIYFRPGSIPPQRQIFYQFGNVELPEVQALLAKPTTECHERRGWLEPGVAEQCRDHMFRYVKQALIANNSDDFKLKQLQSDGESGEDDGESSTVEET